MRDKGNTKLPHDNLATRSGLSRTTAFDGPLLSSQNQQGLYEEYAPLSWYASFTLLRFRDAVKRFHLALPKQYLVFCDNFAPSMLAKVRLLARFTQVRVKRSMGHMAEIDGRS